MEQSANFRPTGGCWRIALVAMLGTAVLLVPATGPAFAQAGKKAAPAKAAKSDGEGGADAALKAYDAGVKSWQSGKADGAVEHLSAAIGTSKLPPQQMARALYYRGLANRKLGKPAMAISDLQSALWLKGALTESERSEALAARAAAYKEAGIADPNGGKVAESSAPVTSASTPKVSAAPPMRAAEAKAPPPPPIQTTPVRDTYAPIGPRVDSPAARTAAAPAAEWQTKVRGSTTAKTPPAATASVAVPAAASAVKPPVPAPPATTQGLQGTAYTPGAGVRTAAAVPAAAAAPAPPPEQAQPASGSGFFSNLFGGLTTGSTAPAAPEMPERRVAPKGLQPDPDAGKPPIPDGPITSAEGRPARAQKVAAAPAAAGGKYLLQVAAANSRPDAERIAAQLKRDQAKLVGQRGFEIDQAGSVWHVRLGPFASANEPRNICVKLRPAGYDCMVVTQ